MNQGADAMRLVAAGAGRMGRSMSIAFAWVGRSIDLLDLKPRDDAGFRRLADEARAEIDAHLGSLIRVGLIDADGARRVAARIGVHPVEAAATVLGRADLVFEGVPEVLDDKRSAFALIESHARRDCLIASTTSTFLATELAAMLSHPARFLNAHWLNPAYLIPLVEVSPHAGTDEHATRQLCEILRQAGKEPVICAPSPGFIVPRLQALLMNEAVRLVEEGVASAEDVDRATRLGFGLRYASMGVLEFIDIGGLDILHRASGYLADTIDAQRYATPALVEQCMREGRIGLRTGQGIYAWQNRNPDQQRDDALARMVAMLEHQKLLKPPVL